MPKTSTPSSPHHVPHNARRPLSLALALTSLSLALSCSRNTSPREPSSPLPSTRLPAAWTGQGPRYLTYDQLTPPVSLPAPASTQASTQPAPVEAIELFARGRSALLQGQSGLARQLLERAAEADPNSAEIQRLIAQAYYEDASRLGGFASGNSIDKAAAALDRAGRLSPDTGDTWLALARLELQRDRKPEALTALRRAALTSDYRDRQTFSATVDLYLARVLQSLGYDRAAVDRYDRVLTAVGGMTTSLRESPELLAVADRPEVILAELGQIYDRNGQYTDAARVYAAATERDPETFEYHARYARSLARAAAAPPSEAGAGSVTVVQALEAAQQIVVRFRADALSMALLDEVYTLTGRRAQLLPDLIKLHDQRPNDRSILLALVESLRRTGTSDAQLQAETLLERAVSNGADRTDDTVLLSRLTDLKVLRGDIRGAAATAIRAAASSPSADHQMFKVVSTLSDPSRDNRLRFRDLLQLDVGPSPIAHAVRDYFASRLASAQNNPPVARNRLAAAWRLYPPALLAWADRTLEDAPPRQPNPALSEIMTVAAKLGDGLVQAVEGRRLLHDGDAQGAARSLFEAVNRGTRDPRTQMLLVVSYLRSGQADQARQSLTRLITDFPGDDDVQSQYIALQSGAAGEGNFSPASEQAVADWLRANPSSGQAKATAAALAQSRGDSQAALRLASQVLDSSPDDPAALSAAESIYQRLGRDDDWKAALTSRFDRSPRSNALLIRMIRPRFQSGDQAGLTSLLLKSRDACLDDPELLYQVAQVAMLVGQRDLARQMLADVLKFSPVHPVAANDWAYEIAELPNTPASDLARAEQFSRLALEQDPENPAFIDTLGWILYKRGDFAQALKHLERAHDLSREPDPTILDHLGDAAWRAGDKDLAQRRWLEAQRLVNDGRPDNMLPIPPPVPPPAQGDSAAPSEASLRLSLRNKLQALQNNAQPPVAELSPAAQGSPSTRP